jgi:ubiquinone/menaquinone biosynthesis C-methylase UbiE
MTPVARLRAHERTNLRTWERVADWYERRHSKTLERDDPMGWGMWHRTERELRVLGEVRGRDVLELGCGAGRWAVGLAHHGARVVALDLSPTRLRQARAEVEAAGVEVRLVEASAESVPLPSKSFDIVFCDWGALTFADPYRTIPEASRLLRDGGLLAFLTSSPFRSVCTNRRSDRLTRRLQNDYFTLHREEFPGEVNFNLGYGDWIRLFRANALTVEDLLEIPPPRRARTTYLTKAEADWAHHWPIEVIWRARKSGTPAGAVARRGTRSRRRRSGGAAERPSTGASRGGGPAPSRSRAPGGRSR